MTDIKGESFEVRLEDDNATVCFKGALRLSGTEDYAPILDLLKTTLVDPTKPIVLDLRELDFLNSSGITMLSRFVIEASEHIGIHVQFLGFGGHSLACSLPEEPSATDVTGPDHSAKLTYSQTQA